MRELLQKIEDKTVEVGVIGMGYVGLPLAVEIASSGIKVLGIEGVESKVKQINEGSSYIPDVSPSAVSRQVQSGRFRAVNDFKVLSSLDAIIICVPTPLGKTKDPDLSMVVAAVERIAEHLRRNQLIVLESTTYPGTTEELMLPKFEESGLKVGKDFFLAFSPERVDPGNSVYNTRNTPKVIGGVTSNCLEVASKLYQHFIDNIVPVSSSRSAEMVKLLENTFRSVNIGLVNEVALMCDRLKLDVWEVIDAAATKPFGFMRFYPGPGLGGHCIPIDPHYLSWKLKTLNYTARFIELASEINGQMPHYVVSKVVDALNDQGKSVRGARLLVLGVAYKKDVGDVRESPALDVVKLLADRGGEIRYNDPYAFEVVVDGGQRYRSVPLDGEELEAADLVIIVTNHAAYDYDFIVAHARRVLDTRNATRHVRNGREKVVRL